MDSTSDRRLDIRPTISSAHFNDQMGFDEHFQNKTLRSNFKTICW